MTTDKEAPPAPPYDHMAEVHPPAYPSHEAAPALVVDEKAHLAAAYPFPDTSVLPHPAAAPADGESLATIPTTLQPWGRRAAYPAGSLIPEATWKAFLADLRSAVAPAGKQKAVAVLAGIAAWGVTGWLPLGGLAGALVWKKATEKRVAQDLAAMQLAWVETDAKTLRTVVDQYNALWQGLGVRVRLDAVDKHAHHFCQCETPTPPPKRRGCCGNGGCGGRARRCGSCGKWRGRPGGGKMRAEVRRPIVQITVERVPRSGDVVRSAPSTPGATTPAAASVETLPHDDRSPSLEKKEKWIEVTDAT